MTLPNFIIAGFRKASTTSLYHYLEQHPQVFMPPLKEPKFFVFNPDDPWCANADLYRFPIRTLGEYEALYANAEGALAIGEASPVYVDSPFALTQIAKFLPNVRLIFCLRQPVERAYSLYLMGVRNAAEDRSFDDAVKNDLERWSSFKYYNTLKPWFEQFSAKQIRVILAEDLKTNPVGVVQDLYQFLDLDPNFTPDTSQKHNVGGIPKNMMLQRVVTVIRRSRLRRIIMGHIPEPLRNAYTNMHKRNLEKAPPIPPDAARLLTDLYREDVSALQGLLQRDLSIWNLN